MIVRYDKATPSQKESFNAMNPYAWICANPYYRREQARIQTIEDAREKLIRSGHHHLIKLNKSPFAERLHTVEDWLLYGVQECYFIVHDIYTGSTWWQPIRSFNLEKVKDESFWISESVEEAIDVSEGLIRCPNCNPGKELSFFEHSVLVPIEIIADYFLDQGWDKEVVDTVILGHRPQEKVEQTELEL